MKNRNILISGAGIAGLTLAYWLKKRGFCPTVVEKHPFPRTGGYKLDVRGVAIDVMKKMGVYQELVEADVRLNRSTFITGDLQEFEFAGDILGHSCKEDLDVGRADLCNILAKATIDIEVIYGDAVVSIDGNRVQFEKMEPKEFDLIIGADGLHSNVRRLVFGDEAQFLKDYGVHFSVFPIPNIFNLDSAQVVYFDNGKLVSAYAAKDQSYASFAFRADGKMRSRDLEKSTFEEQFKGLGWEIPRLLDAMKESDACYFDSIAQIRMPKWSKGRVALVGDAAHAASSIGTTLAIVGAYILANELERSNGEYTVAYATYEERMRPYVERGQSIAESNVERLANTQALWLVKIQLSLMKRLPKIFLEMLTKWETWIMKRASRQIQIEGLS